jgi:hypothetical protein
MVGVIGCTFGVCPCWVYSTYVASAAIGGVVQESERETSELQQQLSAAVEQRSQLHAALEAATTRQREHEQLATDLTHAVQQQKGQIQALQHDKEDLQRQLQRCTPKVIPWGVRCIAAGCACSPLCLGGLPNWHLTPGSGFVDAFMPNAC